MPTPSAEGIAPVPRSSERTNQSTCPPEQVRVYTPRSLADDGSLESEIVEEYTLAPLSQQQPTPPPEAGPSTSSPPEHALDKASELELDRPPRDIPSPLSATEESSENEQRPLPTPSSTTSSVPIPHPAFAQISSPKRRFAPNSTCSFLRHGSKFHGTQKSDRQVYDVQVEIQHVDMEESFLCGYLRIQGLTDDHPTLTTYFEGEMIGTKHSFLTKHAEWGATEKTDMQHWARFPAWRPLAKQAKRQDFNFKNFAQRENIFMRWKEYFLVPDHRVRTITGASFEGFYYICLNQVAGSISGIYFHAKSEKYQQLELEHVSDHGCMGAIEFR